jgi:phosphoglycolate phosphatase
VTFDRTEAVLFDLDGTLIDSAPDLAAALNATMEKMGRRTYGEERVRHWVGNGARTLVSRALSGSRTVDEGLDDALLAEALEIFMEAYRARLCERTRLYPGVAGTLERLAAAGLKMAVVTNKPGPFVAPILRKLGIEGFFALTLGGEDLPEKKPHPMPLLHAADTLQAPAARCLMVGDSRNDILAARRAGMPSVAVTYGYNYGENVADYGPDAVADRFEEIAAFLEGRP